MAKHYWNPTVYPAFCRFLWKIMGVKEKAIGCVWFCFFYLLLLKNKQKQNQKELLSPSSFDKSASLYCNSESTLGGAFASFFVVQFAI
ncbi:hypothetical protein, partial [Amphritea sp.]|uniref:hypothetical protein n=1 Tax=Amphritea sp. TaxID=1872502 RepID=UPI003D11D067